MIDFRLEEMLLNVCGDLHEVCVVTLLTGEVVTPNQELHRVVFHYVKVRLEAEVLTWDAAGSGVTEVSLAAALVHADTFLLQDVVQGAGGDELQVSSCQSLTVRVQQRSVRLTGPTLTGDNTVRAEGVT